MMTITETCYYTVEFLAGFGSDVWLYAANDKNSRELTEDEARKVRDHLSGIGLPYRVRLHSRQEAVQIVEDKS